MIWINNDRVLCGICNNISKLKIPIRIASFDLDNTLIPYNRNKSIPWSLLYPTIVDKLNHYHDDNYIFVMFTNQSAMRNKTFDIDFWKSNFEKIISQIFGNKKIYLAIYASKCDDYYRKPNLGMWNLMKQDFIHNFKIKKISTLSFFCGDAAGRINGKQHDFSDTDRKFAHNIGINFTTPEELFQNHASLNYMLKGICPNNIPSHHPYSFHPKSRELIIMVGLPTSGKSYFIDNYVRDYIKLEKYNKIQINSLLKQNKSIIIDGNHPTANSRSKYLELAKKNNYHIRCIVMVTSIELARHLNNVRHVYSVVYENNEISKIPRVCYHIYNNTYQEPQPQDFDTVEKINFNLDSRQTTNKNWMRIFKKYSEY